MVGSYCHSLSKKPQPELLDLYCKSHGLDMRTNPFSNHPGFILVAPSALCALCIKVLCTVCFLVTLNPFLVPSLHQVFTNLSKLYTKYFLLTIYSPSRKKEKTIKRKKLLIYNSEIQFWGITFTVPLNTVTLNLTNQLIVNIDAVILNRATNISIIINRDNYI